MQGSTPGSAEETETIIPAVRPKTSRKTATKAVSFFITNSSLNKNDSPPHYLTGRIYKFPDEKSTDSMAEGNFPFSNANPDFSGLAKIVEVS